MSVAKSIIDTILGEATSGTQQERFADMLAIASVIANRAEATNTKPEDVVSVKSQFNAYDKALPEGADAYRGMAETAWSYVSQKGPVHNGTYYATRNATANLPKGLQPTLSTKGHQFFTDPESRPIVTAKGTKAVVNPVVAMPHQMEAPLSRQSNVAQGRYANPMSIYGARTTSEFGPRSSPMGIGSRNHRGLDMTAAHGRGQTGVPVQSIASGQVTFAGPARGYGNMVEIAHNDGFTSRYAHLDTIPESIAVGMQINAGTPIGTLGNTGVSSGPHLHLEVMDDTGRHVNPRDYVNLEAKAPPIPETNPNRAETLMAENPHEGRTNTQGMAPVAQEPSGLMGYAPTQAPAVQSAPQMSQAPTANPHAAMQSYEGRAPAVTVAETPSQIAAAEMAMNDPAFSFSAPPSLSQVADSRIDAAFSAPQTQAFSLDDANSAWGGLAAVTPGLSQSLAAAGQHTGPNMASFNVAAPQYAPNVTQTANTQYAPQTANIAQTAPMSQAEVYADAARSMANTGITNLSGSRTSMPEAPVTATAFAAPQSQIESVPTLDSVAMPDFSAYVPDASMFAMPDFSAPTFSVPGVPTFDPMSTPTFNPHEGLIDTQASNAIAQQMAQEATQGILSAPMAPPVSHNEMQTNVPARPGMGNPGIARGFSIGTPGIPEGLGLGPRSVAEMAALAMAGYTPGLAFPGAPGMMAGMLSPSGSYQSYSDMAAISPAAAAAVADGTAGLY